jgi:hypothetical protein
MVIRADRRRFICLGLNVVGAAAIAGARSWAAQANGNQELAQPSAYLARGKKYSS